MKKRFFKALAIIMLAQYFFAQNDTTIKNDPDNQIQNYLKKSREHKIGGGISIVFGGLMAIAAKNQVWTI